jgi:MoaA/NifB/PqqE/SkfB family radical SAM enzyme
MRPMRRPLHVILDVTARCNLKCVMCYFAETDRLHFPPQAVRVPDDGNMPVATFEKIAGELFPRAWRVALGCAAEPMIHPRFGEILEIAGRYGVPDLWFPTNLLALSETTLEAMIQAKVRTVAASIDGVTKETYEKIRVPARWEQLLARLELLREVKKRRRLTRPRLRIIFTWMKSNRGDLGGLPAFAERQGASELDVRYVAPTVGVDVTPELLTDEDPRGLNAELAATAREAVRRGLRLASYPEFEGAGDRPRDPLARVARRLWRIRAGIDKPEHIRYAWRQRLYGCAYPDRYYVIRPNGAVAPCIYWEGDPIGISPVQGFGEIARDQPLAAIRDGLRRGEPIGSCVTCSQRRTELYRLSPLAPAPDASRLPTHPR